MRYTFYAVNAEPELYERVIYKLYTSKIPVVSDKLFRSNETAYFMYHTSSVNPNLMLLLPFDVTLIIRVYVFLVSQQIAQTVTGLLNFIIHARWCLIETKIEPF